MYLSKAEDRLNTISLLFRVDHRSRPLQLRPCNSHHITQLNTAQPEDRRIDRVCSRRRRRPRLQHKLLRGQSMPLRLRLLLQQMCFMLRNQEEAIAHTTVAAHSQLSTIAGLSPPTTCISSDQMVSHLLRSQQRRAVLDVLCEVRHLCLITWVQAMRASGALVRSVVR